MWNVSTLPRVAAVVAATLLTSATAADAAVYVGNGASGFGGPIGGSTLTVTEGASTVNFSLTAGANFNSNALVLYIDSVAGGVGSTTTLTDNADGGRTAISGLSGNGRTTATFSAGFGADYAITLEPGVFGGVFNLSTPANFGFVASTGLSGSGTGPFTFSVNKSNLGLTAGSSFGFVGTLISTTGYRSNETIGASVTVPGSSGDSPNAGFTGTTTFNATNTFTLEAAVPEPASVGVVALCLTAVAMRRRRMV
jgi:hypothetical protein